MPKVFITGASGFAGQHLINCLGSKYSIIGLTSSSSHLIDQDRVRYYSGNINDSNLIYTILNEHKPEYIVHLAAKTTTWFKDVDQVFEINVMGTINLYETISKLKSEIKYNPKILYISSSEVYGNTNTPDFINEDAPFFPVNHYASSKASADRVSYDYTQSKKLNIIILRAFTHTGPGQRIGFFVPDMVSQIVKLEDSPSENELMVGNLDAVRDYLDVRDVVNAYKLILEADIPSGEAFNICSGRGVKVAEILNKLLQFSHKKIVVKNDPDRMRPSDVPSFIGDNSKIRSIIDWKPSIELNATLEETLNYWRINKN
ncbi:MAG: GDP-mannose 4,6-dehydratase [bacterium]|nr:GDP-mannose 4,6-dehydratase [bacterium]